jgi:hypothetical protein
MLSHLSSCIPFRSAFDLSPLTAHKDGRHTEEGFYSPPASLLAVTPEQLSLLNSSVFCFIIFLPSINHRSHQTGVLPFFFLLRSVGMMIGADNAWNAAAHIP